MGMGLSMVIKLQIVLSKISPPAGKHFYSYATCIKNINLRILDVSIS